MLQRFHLWKIHVHSKAYQQEKNQTRLTLTNYPDDCWTPTANMLLVKILLNVIILLDGTKVIVENSNFYLNTPLK